MRVGTNKAQFPALWHLKSESQETMPIEPDAFLVPKPGRDYQKVWSQSGALQIARDDRYNAQRVMTTLTDIRSLGVREWHTLTVRDDNPLLKPKLELALLLWTNSILGWRFTQVAPTIPKKVEGRAARECWKPFQPSTFCNLPRGQLDEAVAIWNDFKGKKFRPLHECAVDPVRIRLDQRVLRDLLGLDEDAIATATRIRTLLATEPCIHGSQEPQLPLEKTPQGDGP